MDWREIRKSGHIRIGEKIYDLSHLENQTIPFSIAETDNHPEIQAKMLIQFDSHCVSKGPPKGQVFDFSKIGHEYKVIDSGGIERKFCPDRYLLSQHLPKIIRSLPQGRTCYFTNRGVWLTVENLSPGGQHQFYDVFFRVQHKTRCFLRTYVQSAHIRGPSRGQQQRSFKKKDKINSKTLLAKKLRNEHIRRPTRAI